MRCIPFIIFTLGVHLYAIEGKCSETTLQQSAAGGTLSTFTYTSSSDMLAQTASITLDLSTLQIHYTENPGRCLFNCQSGLMLPAQEWSGTLGQVEASSLVNALLPLTSLITQEQDGTATDCSHEIFSWTSPLGTSSISLSCNPDVSTEILQLHSAAKQVLQFCRTQVTQ